MPLSENEERALAEIARHLSEEDPKFAASVSTATVAATQRRRLRLAVAGFLTGFVLLLGLIVSFWIAAAGFALMFLSVLVGYRSWKVLSDGETDFITQLRKRTNR
jgi:hypothetical protein